MASKSKNFILFALLALVVFVLVLPISNFFLKRESIEVIAGVPQFKPVSKILQNKCVDCHTPGMLAEPIYMNFPFADKLIKDDIDAAQKHIVFSKEHLNGTKPFTRQEAARLLRVVENNEMPIAPYRLMHWNSVISEEDSIAVADWLKAQFNTGE
jgi:cytochrome c peroxidase